ncbi:transferase 2, rSAM/selenodomain-associated [Fusobacterium necrogenes]|uniref:Transferase 2, rSAM/selenodomain-associated n=1 Tax=Fusobacterium necrogenes TaxID=858 RepID=A0A377GW12_9FUSO|nr:glycosyltransferase family 2 protein [Fusobacterium necrogenes]STO31139.1 transferase 2, rSAM/selenodomain-associated [Fusobacterium necrogenes]
MEKISIIVPIYNGEKYLEKLVSKIKEQEINKKIELIALVTKSKDTSLKKAKELFDIVLEIEKFNHAKTRHEGALKSSGGILVFITQDILPYDNQWLKNLIEPLNEKIIASFSRQIAYEEHSNIEKIIREFNYPNKDRICNKEMKEKNGRKNIFYSDASSAIIKEKFFELGGYNFEVPTNEDVYLANKIVENGYSFLYASQSRIWHSHQLSLKDTYKRYKDIGKFEKLYKNEIDFSKTQSEGNKVLLFLIKELLKRKNIKELIYLPFDIGARWIGYKMED